MLSLIFFGAKNHGTSQKHNGKKRKKKRYARNSNKEIEPEQNAYVTKKRNAKNKEKKKKLCKKQPWADWAD